MKRIGRGFDQGSGDHWHDECLWQKIHIELSLEQGQSLTYSEANISVFTLTWFTQLYLLSVPEAKKEHWNNPIGK